MSAQRNKVETYLGKRAFYKKDMEKKHRAGQHTTLPPRCTHCRLPGMIMLGADPHCDKHGLCGECDKPA